MVGREISPKAAFPHYLADKLLIRYKHMVSGWKLVGYNNMIPHKLVIPYKQLADRPPGGAAELDVKP